jgi:hypothetical protein
MLARNKTSQQKRLLDVLDLLAHLLDQDFQFDGGIGHFGINGF